MMIKKAAETDIPTALRFGDPERIRTSGLRFRKPTLYPAELRDRMQPYFREGRANCQRRKAHIPLFNLNCVILNHHLF